MQRGILKRNEDLASSFQIRVVNILVKKVIRAMKEYNVPNLIVAGGVAANKCLRARLIDACEKEGFNVVFPAMKYCTDNAAMIGAAGYYAYKLGRIADLNINSKANDELN